MNTEILLWMATAVFVLFCLLHGLNNVCGAIGIFFIRRFKAISLTQQKRSDELSSWITREVDAGDQLAVSPYDLILQQEPPSSFRLKIARMLSSAGSALAEPQKPATRQLTGASEQNA